MPLTDIVVGESDGCLFAIDRGRRGGNFFRASPVGSRRIVEPQRVSQGPK